MATNKTARKDADNKALRKLAERNLSALNREMGWTEKRSARDHELDVQDTMARLRAMRRGSTQVSVVGQRSQTKRKKPKRRAAGRKKAPSILARLLGLK